MPPRTLRLVDEYNFKHFRRRWREIDQLWDPFRVEPEHWDAIRTLRFAARDELRAELRDAVLLGEPKYLIAV